VDTLLLEGRGVFGGRPRFRRVCSSGDQSPGY